MYWGRIVVVIGVLAVIAGLVYWIVMSTRITNKETERWWIAGQSVDCVGESPQRCLQVRKGENESVELLYTEIDGFSYREGTEYELLVSRETLDEMPADASSQRYELVKVLSETEIPYVMISSITTGAKVELVGNGNLLIAGRGRGLFENNVVVRLLDGQGTVMDEGNTLLQIDETGGEGEWEMSFVSPNVSTDNGFVEAVSPSPKDGSETIRYRVPVQFVRDGVTLKLEGQQWNLVGYRQDEAVMTALSGTTMKLVDGEIRGSGGCNNYFGSYTVDDDRMSVSGIGSTLMYCEDLMEQETAYLQLLEQVRGYEIVDSQLQLYGEDATALLVFEPAKVWPLEGSWNLRQYNNGKETIVRLETGIEITAVFEGGKMVGSAGCNNYTTSYEAKGTEITLGEIGVTRKLCQEPEGVMDQEQAYLSALGTVKQFSIDNGVLSLFNEEGVRQAVYDRVVGLEQ